MTGSHAKALRANMTEAERRLLVFPSCASLRGNEVQATGIDWPIHCRLRVLSERLVVEVDGGQLAESEDDLRRTRWLESEGFRILRFWNNEVLSSTGGVLDVIMAAGINPYPGTPLRCAPPSPTRGEGKNDSEL
jgi:very-short-patch-repair endonuclease